METGEDVRVLLTLGLNCVVMEQIITVMDRLMKIVVNRFTTIFINLSITVIICSITTQFSPRVNRTLTSSPVSIYTSL